MDELEWLEWGNYLESVGEDDSIVHIREELDE